jgi:prepilin-type N-terminal cleavage/methylation domain-containing protein
MAQASRFRRGFSLIELLIVIAIVTTLVAIASVSANAILKHSRETAALAHVQTLIKAQTQFYSVKRRYAGALQDLGPDTANLIPEHLASGQLGGYRFEVSGDEDSFTIKANPERKGKTGDSSYFSDDSLVIRHNEQTVADHESPPVK